MPNEQGNVGYPLLPRGGALLSPQVLGHWGPPRGAMGLVLGNEGLIALDPLGAMGPLLKFHHR